LSVFVYMKFLLSLGTNIGNPIENLKTAISSLNNTIDIKVLSVSSVYKTAPVGFDDQDDFFNAVCLIDSALPPYIILGICLGIESAMGRVRTIKNGPRIIDIDILLCENFISNSSVLTVPHPRMNERAFVLIPMLDLFPDGNIYDFDFDLSVVSGQICNFFAPPESIYIPPS
jgi:2-amino-4-hydroxy-6-hydroxymethyldihydropteridine pyrophosphokinase